MDYRYLSAFREASRFGNFQQAAAKLNIAPSALTRQIQLFESSVEQECFVRAGRNVKLTPFGEQLYQQVLEFEKKVKATDGAIVTLRIGSLQSVFESVLAEIITKNLSDLGHQLVVDIGNPQYLENQLKLGHLDIIFNNAPVALANFTSRPILKENLVFAAKNKNMLENPAKANWIIYTPLERAWDSLKIDRKKATGQVIRVNSFNSAIELTCLGAGLSILPSGANLTRRGLHQEILKHYPTETIYLTHLAYRQLPPSLDTLLKSVRGKCKKGFGN